jgi:hypothetical protein
MESFLYLGIILVFIYMSTVLVINNSRLREGISAAHLVAGFGVMFAITSIVAWTKVSKSTYLILIFLLFAGFITKLIILRKLPRLQISSWFALGFMFYMIVLLTTFHGYGMEFRLFTNSDPNFYSIVTGGVIRFGSLPKLFDQFQGFMGVPFKFNYNWDFHHAAAASKLINLPFDPYTIPDGVVKWGIQNGFYLHNGGPFLALPFVMFAKNSIQVFYMIWSICCFIGVGLFAGVVFEAAHKILKVRFEFTKMKTLGLVIIVATILVGVYWIPLLINEAFVNQINSWMLTLAAFCIASEVATRIRNKKESLWVIFPIFGIIGGVMAVYLLQTPLAIFAFLIGILHGLGLEARSEILSIIKRNKLVVLIGSVALLYPVYLVLTGRQVREVYTSLLSSTGAGAVHIGAVSPLAALGLNMKNSVVIAPTFRPNMLMSDLKLVDWPFSAYDNRGWRLAQQGYNVQLTSMHLLKLILVVLIIITLAMWFFKYFRKTLYPLLLMALPFELLPLFYLYTKSGSYLKSHPNSGFSDYMWMRILAVFTIFVIPLVITFIFMLVYYEKPKQVVPRGKKAKNAKVNKELSYPIILQSIFLVFLSILFLFRTVDIYHQGSLFTKYSEIAYPTKSCPKFIFEKPVPYLVSNAIIPVVALGQCGVDLELISNTDAEIRKPDGVTHNVYGIIRRARRVNWEITKLGTLKLQKNLISPCDFNCIQTVPGFTPEKSIKWKVLN